MQAISFEDVQEESLDGGQSGGRAHEDAASKKAQRRQQLRQMQLELFSSERDQSSLNSAKHLTRPISQVTLSDLLPPPHAPARGPRSEKTEFSFNDSRFELQQQQTSAAEAVLRKNSSRERARLPKPLPEPSVSHSLRKSRIVQISSFSSDSSARENKDDKRADESGESDYY